MALKLLDVEGFTEINGTQLPDVFHLLLLLTSFLENLIPSKYAGIFRHCGKKTLQKGQLRVFAASGEKFMVSKFCSGLIQYVE